jgi:hypothetical protein
MNNCKALLLSVSEEKRSCYFFKLTCPPLKMTVIFAVKNVSTKRRLERIACDESFPAEYSGLCREHEKAFQENSHAS